MLKERVAEELSRALAKSGKTAKEIADKCKIDVKRLQRWLHNGITRTRGKTPEDQKALQRVCAELGVDLWRQPGSERVAELDELVTIVRRRWAGSLIQPLLDEIARSVKAARIADELAKDRPDLVPRELAGTTPFEAYFSLAKEYPSSDLLRLLLAKRALEEPATWAKVNAFHAGKKLHFSEWLNTERAKEYPRATARLCCPGPQLKELVRLVNYRGDVGWKSEEDRQTEFWKEVARIEQECQPIELTSGQLQERFGSQYPRAVAQLLLKDPPRSDIGGRKQTSRGVHV